MPVRTLLFDLGNVLVSFSHERMCEQIATLCGLSTGWVRELLFDEGWQMLLERGVASEAELHQVLEEAAGRSIEWQALRTAACDIFAVNQELVALLPTWKRAGYRLVLLSNTCASHYEWVRERYAVIAQFDRCVLSYEVGAVKPDERIFRSALEQIDCSPGECFYTDDIPRYVECGRAMGLQAEVFTDVPTLLGHLSRRGVPTNSRASSFEAAG